VCADRDQLHWDNADFHKLSYPDPLRKTNPYHLMVQAFANQRKLGLDAPLDALKQRNPAGSNGAGVAAAPLVAAVAAEMAALQPRPLNTETFASLPLANLTTLQTMVPAICSASSTRVSANIHTENLLLRISSPNIP
jgi:hypothetical protein